MAITSKGRELRDNVNIELSLKSPKAWVPFDALHDLSRLMRLATTYARRAEESCCYEWAAGPEWERKDEQLEARIREIVETIPYIETVSFAGDPRGYVVRLHTLPPISNTLGGEEAGFGIA